MKIQIDTEEKTLTILESCEIEELIGSLKKLLGDEYGKYKIIVLNTTVYIPWTNPIVINPWAPYNPWTIWTTSAASVGESTYNIDLQEYNSNIVIN